MEVLFKINVFSLWLKMIYIGFEKFTWLTKNRMAYSHETYALLFHIFTSQFNAFCKLFLLFL